MQLVFFDVYDGQPPPKKRRRRRKRRKPAAARSFDELCLLNPDDLTPEEESMCDEVIRRRSAEVRSRWTPQDEAKRRGQARMRNRDTYTNEYGQIVPRLESPITTLGSYGDDSMD